MEPGKENFDRRMQEIIGALPEGLKPRLLLHSCCGPCSSAVLERLCPFFAVTVFYYNPNIQPREEFEKRLSEQERLLREMTPAGQRVELLAGDWEEEKYLKAVRGLEKEKEGGKRCEACFRLRLQVTADRADALGFGFFTTTLTVSPHKNAALVNREGALAEQGHSARFLPADFKKRDGYLRSLLLSREYGLYRQDYCGCLFSRTASPHDGPEEE